MDLSVNRRSFEKTDALTAAMGSFVLGCKVEEAPTMLREVVFVFFELFLEKNRLPIQSLEVSHPIFSDWKSELIMIERMILKELGFSLYTIADHPHQYIVYIMNKLQGIQEAQLTTLAESAWHYLNESKRADIELRYEPLAIACAAVLLASKIHDITLPSSPEPWWLTFEVDYDAMKDVCNEILDIYDLDVKADTWIPPLVPVEYQRRTLAAFGGVSR